MDNKGNSSTFFDDGILCPSKLALHRDFNISENLLTNYTTMGLNKCLELHILDETEIEYIKNRTFCFNGTGVKCIQNAPVLTVNAIIRGSVLSAMAILSFFGNVATIVSIQRGKRDRGRARPSCTAIYSLIFHLTIADLLVTIFCLTGEAAWSFTVQWCAGNIMCKLYKFLQMFALYLSTFILVLIGVDRWIAVKYPMKSMAAPTRSGRIVIIAWILSLVLSIPQAVAFRVAKGDFYEEFYQCVTHGFYTETWQEQTYATLSFVTIFAIPLVILVSTYVSTVWTIAQSKKFFRPEVRQQETCFTPDMNRRRLIDRAKMKSLRMSVVIVAAFLVCWTPNHIMMFIFMFLNPDQKQSEDLQNGIFFFGMSNSLINPVIYGAFHLWPKKKKCHQHSGRESGGLRSMLRRGDDNNTSLVTVTTLPSLRASAKYSNGYNVSLL